MSKKCGRMLISMCFIMLLHRMCVYWFWLSGQGGNHDGLIPLHYLPSLTLIQIHNLISLHNSSILY